VFDLNPIRMNPLRSFGFLLKDVSRLYVQRFEQRAGALGLTLPQCKALVYLAQREGISQAQLSALADIEPMSLVRILDRMESDGWLERRSDPADRRARRLYLNAKAKPLLRDIWRLADVTRGEAFAGVSKQHAELLITLLENIRSNFDSLEPLPAAPSISTLNTRGRGIAGAARARRERVNPQP
jgi:MarR family transcriptional regulator for hemolysin